MACSFPTSGGPKAHHAHERHITARPRNFQKGTSAITKGTSLLKNTMATHYAPRVPKPQQQLPEAPLTLRGSIVKASMRWCSGMEPPWPRHHRRILLEIFSYHHWVQKRYGTAAKPKASLGQQKAHKLWRTPWPRIMHNEPQPKKHLPQHNCNIHCRNQTKGLLHMLLLRRAYFLARP